MLNTFIQAISQVIALSLIPLLVYLIRFKRFKGFFNYIGLKKSNTKANVLALLLMLMVASPVLGFAAIDADFRQALFHPTSVSGRIRMMGFGLESVVTIFSIALIKTALSEEILFRGFIAKRLIAVTSFRTGNALQAILFGAIHIVPFWFLTDNVPFLVVIFIIPTLGGYLKVILNEKLADGSIIPGWISHASGNLIAYSVIAFVF